MVVNVDEEKCTGCGTCEETCPVESIKVQDKKLVVLDKWTPKKKTKEMTIVLKKMKIANALIVLNEPTDWLERTVRNIPYIDVAYANKLNAYNIIARDYLICTKDVVGKIEEGLKS